VAPQRPTLGLFEVEVACVTRSSFTRWRQLAPVRLPDRWATDESTRWRGVLCDEAGLYTGTYTNFLW